MRTAALALAVLLGASGAARAEPPESETRIRHYGWQVLAVDAASMGVGFFTVPDNAWAYLIGYGLGAPAVHLAHRNVGRAMISFGGRVMAFALVMGRAGGGSGDEESATPYMVAAVGFMLADAAFAWDRCPVPPPAPSVRPVLTPLARDAWTAGLAGQF